MHTIYSWWKTRAVWTVEADTTVGAVCVLHITPLPLFKQASGYLNFNSICSETSSDPPYSHEKKITQMNKLLFSFSIHKAFCYTIMHCEVLCPAKWNVSGSRLTKNFVLIGYNKSPLQLWTSCSCNDGCGQKQF